MTQLSSVNRALVSICVPVYNEQENIISFYDRIKTVLDSISDRYRFELLFTDNHSEDATFSILSDLSLVDHRVRVIRFSRNVGFQRSILMNYSHCRGVAAIQIDVDLQDPPELMVEFLRLWEKGYKVVYGVRRVRPDEGWILFNARKFFYRLIDFLSEDRLPHDAGDFRLIDRCILDALKSNRDQQPYLRGMIAAMGFNQIGIVYDRAARRHGRSKFDIWRLLGLAIDGIMHHSVVPLRLATVFGLGLSCLSLAAASYYICMRLFYQNKWPSGIATLYVLVLFSIGMNALLIGIAGEYIGRIYKNVKQSPIALIEHAIEHNSPQPCREVSGS